MNKLYNSKVLGTGSYLPQKIVSNFDLEKIVDTSNQWIVERTGINTRRISSEDGSEAPSMMAAEASKKALADANLTPEDVDFVIIATITPDYNLPNTASLVQQHLGIKNECPCVDLSAACSGFVYASVMADSMIKTGLYKNVLIVGTETLSSITNWEDRTTCVLFSDGAGAMVLGRNESDDASAILSATLGCDGTGAQFLKVPSGGVVNPTTTQSLEQNRGTIHMEGRQVFKYATRTMTRNAESVLKQANLKSTDVNWFIPHQANMRIIEYIAKKVEIEMERVIVTVDKYGNNSSATIPIAFDEAIQDGRIKRGDNVIFDAFGAGVTSGALLMKY